MSRSGHRMDWLEGCWYGNRGSIEAVFAAAGIETLDVTTGVDIFIDEALAGGKREVLAVP